MKISIGQNDKGGFGLAVKLEVNVAGVNQEKAQAFVEKVHQVCPYSNAAHANIKARLTVTNNKKK